MGVRAPRSGWVYRPARRVLDLSQTQGNPYLLHNNIASYLDHLDVTTRKTNLTAIDFDPSVGNTLYFADHSDFSFIRTIEQPTIEFVNNNANSRITIPDDSALSFVEEVNTTVSNFTTTNANRYYTAPDSDGLSFAIEGGVQQVLDFAGNSQSVITVDDDTSLSFVSADGANTTVAVLNDNDTSDNHTVSDNDALSLVGADTQVSAVEFSANANSKLHMTTNSSDFQFGDDTSDVSFTFAFWINATSVTDFQYLFGNLGNEYYALIQNGDIKLLLNDPGESSTYTSPTVSTSRILDGEAGNWVHIAIVYTPETSANANDEQIQFYKNGSAWGSAVVSPNDDYVAMPGSTSGRFTLGHYSHTNTGTNRFAGMLSNFLVFKHDGQNNHASVARSTTPLTAAQVLGLYNGGRVMPNYNNHPKSDDLVAYYKLDEDISEVSQITDYSGEANHLDSIGSAITEDSTSGLLKRQVDSFAVTFWMKRGPAGGLQYILNKGTSSSSTREYAVHCSNRQMIVFINDQTPTDGGGSYGRINYTTTTDFLSSDTGTWEHITIVYDTLTQEMTFHRNGGSAETGVANDTQTKTESQSNTGNDFDSAHNLVSSLAIGCFSAASTSGGFDGRLAHIALFKYGLIANPMTTNLVRALYNGGYRYDYSLLHYHKNYLAAYWKMESATATINSPALDITAGSGGFTTTSDSDLKKKLDSDFTISFWIKRQAATEAYGIVSKHQEYEVLLGGRQIVFRLIDIFGGQGDGFTAFANFATATDFLDDNTTSWQHVAIVYNGVTQSAKFFKNGTLISTDSDPGTGLFINTRNTTNNLKIGEYRTGLGRLEAQLAHLAIFQHDGQSGRSSTIMSDAEVYKLYDRDGTSGSPSSVAGKVWNIHHTHAKQADLVGFWKLEEDVSSTAVIADSSGLGNNGATTGVGTTSLTNPGSSGLENCDFVDNSFTISFWMKKDSTSGVKRLLRKGTTAGVDLEYELYSSNRTLYFQVYDNSPSDGVGSYAYAYYYSDNILSNDTNVWEQITVVFDHSTKTTLFYRNGTLVNTSSEFSGTDYDSSFNGTGVLIIGQSSLSDNTQGFGGSLANLAIFNHDGLSGRSSTIPTAAEVLGLYNGGFFYDYNVNHPKKDDLVGYWKLDSTTATVGDTLTAGSALGTSADSDLKTKQDTDFTIAFWFKRSDTDSSLRYVYSKVNEYEVYLQGDDVILRLFDSTPPDGGATDFISITDGNAFANNVTDWHHCVIRHNASTNNTFCQINGAAAQTMSRYDPDNGYNETQDDTNDVLIGAKSTASNSTTFAGQISNLAVFSHDGGAKTGGGNRSSTLMTEDEAKGLYNGGNVYDYTRHPKSGDLVGYWKLTETVGNGVTVTDSSSEGNNGTMTGATALTNPANSGLNEVKDNSFTFAFWMKRGGTGARVILEKSTEYRIRYINRNIELMMFDATGNDNNSTATVVSATTGNPLNASTGVWEHIIVTYDASTRQTHFYVDGAEAASSTGEETDPDYNEMQDTTNVLYLSSFTASSRFDGQLTAIAVFDHGPSGSRFSDLDAEELYSDGYAYNYRKHSRGSDMVAYWIASPSPSFAAFLDYSGTSNVHNSVGAPAGIVRTPNSGIYHYEQRNFTIASYVRYGGQKTNFLHLMGKGLAWYLQATVAPSSPTIRFSQLDVNPRQVGGAIATQYYMTFQFDYQMPVLEWAHLCLVYSGANSLSSESMSLYVNGQLVETVAQSTADSNNRFTEGTHATGQFKLGATQFGNGADSEFSNTVFFAGTALSAAEVDELYSDGIAYDYKSHSRGSDITTWWTLGGPDDRLFTSEGFLLATPDIKNSIDSGELDLNVRSGGPDFNANIQPTPRIIGQQEPPPQVPLRLNIPGTPSLRTNALINHRQN